MAEMRLDGGETKQHSMLMPALLALLVLLAAGAWFARVYLRPGVTGAGGHVALFPVHTTFARPYGSVGEDQAEDALYVIADVSLTDHTEVPLFIKSIDGHFTMEDGTVMQASAMEKADLPRLMAMFPKMKPLTDTTAPEPLVRDQKIDPGATGHGYVIFSYNVPQSVWDKRKSAEVNFDFYHQDRYTVTLAK